jgi:uroporphyrinogen-III synthase
LAAALRASGAEVVEVTAYHTGAAELRDPVIWSRVRKGEVDVLTFASPSAFQNFADLIGGEGVRRRYAHVPLAAIGPATAAAIRAAGLSVAIEAASASAAEFAAALAAYFQSERPQQKVEEP